MKKQNSAHQQNNQPQTLQVKDFNGKQYIVSVQDIDIINSPSTGDYLFRYRNDIILDLTAEQKKVVWLHQAPTSEPFLHVQEHIALTMQATITTQLSLEWVADTLDSNGNYRGAIVLVKGGIRLLIADQLPESTCQALFNYLLDAYTQRGDQPCITYCSFD